MEVYATIFMIFVSHVLSSFTLTFSTPQKDGKKIPLQKRSLYLKDRHDINEESRWDHSLEKTITFIDGKKENDDNGRNSQYEIDNGKVKSPMITTHLIDSTNFFLSSEKTKLRLRRKQSEGCINSATLKQTLPFSTNSNFFMESYKYAIKNSSQTEVSATEAGSNRGKEQFMTAKPWNYTTGEKKTTILSSLSVKNTLAMNQPWLFYPHRNKKLNPSGKAIDSGDEISSFHLKTKPLVPLVKDIIGCNLPSRIKNIKKRSLKLIDQKKNYDWVEFVSFGRRNKNYKLNNGIPSCPKSSAPNFPDLVNTRSIKPQDYFQRQTTILLSCKNNMDLDCGVTSHSNLISSSDAAPDASNVKGSTLSYDFGTLEQQSDSGEWRFHTTGSALGFDLSNQSLIASDMAPFSASGKTPSLRMFMQLWNTSSKTIVTGQPKDTLNIKVVLNNESDTIDLCGEKLESDFEKFSKSLYYANSSKNNDTFKDKGNIINVIRMGNLKGKQPWDKFCPCLGGTSSSISNEDGSSLTEKESPLNNHPWVTACSKCVGNNDDVEVNTLVPVVYAISTVRPLDSSLQTTKKTHEEGDKFQDSNTKKSINRMRKLIFIRVPIVGPEENNKNESLAAHLPSNKSHSKNIKPRSIVNMFLPSFSKRSTTRPAMHVVNPWEEPWKFREEKFSLFDSSASATYPPAKEHFAKTDEPPLISKSLLDYIAETCPSCSKNKVDTISKTTSKECVTESNNELNDEDIGSYNSKFKHHEDKSDPEYLTNILKLPKVDLTKITSPAIKKIKSLKGLTILHSQDSPPKYFIEVPDLLNNLSSYEDYGITSLSTLSTTKKSKSRTGKIRNSNRKKPLVLFLQPFDINGNNVYLPMRNSEVTGLDKPLESFNNAPTVNYNHYERTSHPLGKAFDESFENNYSNGLPFVLFPAYLVMRSNSHLSPKLFNTDFPSKADDKRKPLEILNIDSYSKTKDQDLSFLLNNFPFETKSNTIVKEPSYSLKMRGTDAYHTDSTKKASRKPLPIRSTVPRRPSLIILVNGTADASFTNGSQEAPLNEGGFFFCGAK